MAASASGLAVATAAAYRVWAGRVEGANIGGAMLVVAFPAVIATLAVVQPEAELERMLAAAAADPAERPAFSSRLLEAQVYVLGHLDEPPTDGLAPAGSSAQIATWADDEGPIVPFFTSLAALERSLAAVPVAGPRYLRLGAKDLFELTRGQRLVLNPHGPTAKVYSTSEIEAFLAGAEPGVSTHTVTEPERVLVGGAADIPDGLLPMLARFLVQRPAVQAAHLGWIRHGDGHEGYLMVVVAPDRDAALHGFGTVQVGELTGGRSLDVIVVPPEEPDHYLASVPPFYVRPPQPDLP